jgi:hypothetical protein
VCVCVCARVCLCVYIHVYILYFTFACVVFPANLFLIVQLFAYFLRHMLLTLFGCSSPDMVLVRKSYEHIELFQVKGNVRAWTRHIQNVRLVRALKVWRG